MLFRSEGFETLSNGGARSIKLDVGGLGTPYDIDFEADHYYRVTIDGGTVRLYVDENDTPVDEVTGWTPGSALVRCAWGFIGGTTEAFVTGFRLNSKETFSPSEAPF